MLWCHSSRIAASALICWVGGPLLHTTPFTTFGEAHAARLLTLPRPACHRQHAGLQPGATLRRWDVCPGRRSWPQWQQQQGVTTAAAAGGLGRPSSGRQQRGEARLRPQPQRSKGRPTSALLTAATCAAWSTQSHTCPRTFRQAGGVCCACNWLWGCSCTWLVSVHATGCVCMELAARGLSGEPAVCGVHATGSGVVHASRVCGN